MKTKIINTLIENQDSDICFVAYHSHIGNLDLGWFLNGGFPRFADCLNALFKQISVYAANPNDWEEELYLKPKGFFEIDIVVQHEPDNLYKTYFKISAKQIKQLHSNSLLVNI